MSEKALRFNNIKVNKNEFHKSKQAIDLDSITIDEIVVSEQKNYPQVYLEECKYKIKKIHTSRFINTELETDSESDVETDSEH